MHLHMDLRRKKGGEKLRKDNRDQVLVMRMTKEEKEKLREIANEEGCTISKFIRKSIYFYKYLLDYDKKN